MEEPLIIEAKILDWRMRSVLQTNELIELYPWIKMKTQHGVLCLPCLHIEAIISVSCAAWFDGNTVSQKYIAFTWKVKLRRTQVLVSPQNYAWGRGAQDDKQPPTYHWNGLFCANMSHFCSFLETNEKQLQQLWISKNFKLILWPVAIGKCDWLEHLHACTPAFSVNPLVN